jgi:16S rRNA (guanine966-N2)-methyltransferase
MGVIRITGGQWSGRHLRVPSWGVRPSQDRIRLAIFSSLGGFVENTRVLDLFAGSGAYGFEALSRGAQTVCWVDRNRRACETIQRNLNELLPPDERHRGCVVCADALDVHTYRDVGPYELILADPPYQLSERPELLAEIQSRLAAHNLVVPGAVLIYEVAARARPSLADGWTLVRERRAGDSRWLLTQWQRPSPNASR